MQRTSPLPPLNHKNSRVGLHPPSPIFLTRCRYAVYQGSSIVKQSNVIIVAINYRLGAFGWLGHASLRSADGSTGNWGLEDQRLAMTWVQVRPAAALSLLLM